MPTFNPAPTESFWGASVVGEPGEVTFGATATGGYRQNGFWWIEWDGTGLTFDAQGRPNGGVITAIRLHWVNEDGLSPGDLHTEITNAAYDAAAFNTALSGPNPLNAFLTAGDDTLMGRPFNPGDLWGETLAGGEGDDTYYIDGFMDHVQEFAGVDSGYDTVIASANHQLDQNVEHLILTGAQDLNGTGNASENVIEGNDGANRLSGGGGHDTLIGNAGNDTLDGGAGPDDMYGGAGDDTFIVDNVDDAVIEAGGQGIDKVQSRITYTLGDNVERLSLSGLDAIDGTGNGLANVITGNDAANTLSGGDGNDILRGGAGDDVLIGGAGSDRMTGGAGADTFVFDVKGAIDRVEDFEDGDTLVFDFSLFATREDVLASIRVNAAGHAVIVGETCRVVLVGLAPGDLTLDDIVILAPPMSAMSAPDEGKDEAAFGLAETFAGRMGEGQDWLM